MNTELLLDRLGESNKFRKKSKKKRLGTSNRQPHIVPKTCFEDPQGDVPRSYQGCSLHVRLGLPLDVISDCSQNVRSGRPQEIISVLLRDGQIGYLWDVLGTSWGPILVGWEEDDEDLKTLQLRWLS